MLISEIMSTCVPECTEDMRLESVFELIQHCDHRLVVVVDSLAHRVPIGVVTERSICEQIIERGRNPRNLLAGSVMDSRIKRVRETDLLEKIIVNEAGLVAVVVVNDSRQVCGLISKEKIQNLSSDGISTHATAAVAAGPGRSTSPRISEIPAFGWVQ